MKVRFNKPGVYKYFCDVHPGMVGYVVVKAKGKKIPSAKKVHAALVKQITGDVKTAKKLAKAKQPTNTVDLGESGKDGVELYTMFPQSLTVQPNTTVTFTMSKHSRETHTANLFVERSDRARTSSKGRPSPPRACIRALHRRSW